MLSKPQSNLLGQGPRGALFPRRGLLVFGLLVFGLLVFGPCTWA